MTSNFYESVNENRDKNNLELSENKQMFRTAFPSKLFGPEGKYFFPGTVEDVSLFISIVNEYKDQKRLFSMYDICPFLEEEIKDWPYNKLACSVLYYYLNIEIGKNNLNSLDWSTIGDFLQSPAISREIFSFVKSYNILKFSSKNEMILGFMNSLMFPGYMSYCKNLKPFENVKSHYRILNLVNVEKFIIRDLIKTTIREQNRLAIVSFLENLFDENEYIRQKRR